MTTMKGNIDMPKIVDQTIFRDAVKKHLGETVDTISRKAVAEICEKYHIAWPNWLTANPSRRVAYGVYSLASDTVSEKTSTEVEEISDEEAEFAQAAMVAQVVPINSTVDVSKPSFNMVPEKVKGYVPFGHFSDVRSIIKSKKFYPMYITGLSGNGKTMMVEQACAAEGRECIRVNITIETDEDDLIGGFRLEDGKTVWQDGPVVVAMQRGAVLLLDEVDLGSNKLMCLQPVLEGKGVFIKKIGRSVYPANGFNVVATANTKGKGSDDGRFVGTNVMNEAFLERFSITLEQEYPSMKAEARILNNVLSKANMLDADFTDRLVAWADVVRKTFAEGAVNEIISTRRLVHICEAFSIFNGNREKAIKLCLNRFDEETKSSFMNLYKKLDETVDGSTTTAKNPLSDNVPF